MKVSFDFDGTLQREDVQQYARELRDRGMDVWIVTTRWDENHKHLYAFNPHIDDLWEVVERLGIPRWKVRFTNMQWKYTYLEDTQFIWHLDDNPEEFERMEIRCPSIGRVGVWKEDWKEQCEQLIKQYEGKNSTPK